MLGILSTSNQRCCKTNTFVAHFVINEIINLSWNKPDFVLRKSTMPIDF